MKLARLLVAFRFLAPGSVAKPQAASVRSRRRSARTAVWSGVAAFVVLTAALAGAVETAKPQWRDPEFALRLEQVRSWRAKAPDRPLVVAFGSSRTQMGISPAAAGFANEPGSPLLYNFGYRGSRQLGTWLHLSRLRDAGIKPDAVLIQLAAPELVIPGSADRQYAAWAPRLAISDLARWEPYTTNPARLREGIVRARLKPWPTYREAILSETFPEWQTPTQRLEFSWEWMDEYGFAPHPSETITAGKRAELHRHVRKVHARSLNNFVPSEIANRALRDLLARCDQEGIAVALFWAPTSPAYRTWVSPKSRAALNEYHARLVRELSVPVFPAPAHLEESDFADGDHLLREGAAKYSRWLAETHVKPWLASQGVGR